MKCNDHREFVGDISGLARQEPLAPTARRVAKVGSRLTPPPTPQPKTPQTRTTHLDILPPLDLTRISTQKYR